MVHREAIVVLGRDDQVAHACCLRQTDPRFGVELLRIELPRHLAVFGGGNLEELHDPLGVAADLDALALPFPGQFRVWPPVDEHAETALSPPLHACIAFSPGLGGRINRKPRDPRPMWILWVSLIALDAHLGSVVASGRPGFRAGPNVRPLVLGGETVVSSHLPSCNPEPNRNLILLYGNYPNRASPILLLASHHH